MPEELKQETMGVEQFANIVVNYIESCNKELKSLDRELEIATDEEKKEKIRKELSIIHENIETLKNLVKLPAYWRIKRASQGEMMEYFTLQSEMDKETIQAKEIELEKLKNQQEENRKHFLSSTDTDITLEEYNKKDDTLTYSISEKEKELAQLRANKTSVEELRELSIEQLKLRMYGKLNLTDQEQKYLRQRSGELSTYDRASIIASQISPENIEEVANACGKIMDLERITEDYVNGYIIMHYYAYDTTTGTYVRTNYDDSVTHEQLKRFKRSIEDGTSTLRDDRIHLEGATRSLVNQANKLEQMQSIVEKIDNGKYNRSDLRELSSLADWMERNASRLNTKYDEDPYIKEQINDFIISARSLSIPRIARANKLFSSPKDKDKRAISLEYMKEHLKFQGIFMQNNSYIRDFEQLIGKKGTIFPYFTLNRYAEFMKEQIADNIAKVRVNESAMEKVNEELSKIEEETAGLKINLDELRDKTKLLIGGKMILNGESLVELYRIFSNPVEYQKAKNHAGVVMMNESINEQVDLQKQQELTERSKQLQAIISATNNIGNEQFQTDATPDGPSDGQPSAIRR